MTISGPAQQDIHSELAVTQRMLPLAHGQALELGCGAAEKTRQISERAKVAHIIAAELLAEVKKRFLAWLIYSTVTRRVFQSRCLSI